MGGEIGVAGVLTFWGVNDVIVLADGEAAGLDPRHDFLLSGARVGGAFQADDLTGAEVGEDGVEGASDVGEVWLVMLGKGSGDADDDGVDLVDAGEVAGGLEESTVQLLADGAGIDVLDVGFAFAEGVDFGFIHIEAEGLEAFGSKAEDYGKTDVAEADDSDGGGAGFEKGKL